MHVGVIGSRGFLGRALMAQLAAQGVSVAEFSSTSAGGIDATTGLFPAGWKLPERLDAVVYLAQSPHYRQLPERAEHVWNVNVTSALRAAEAARASGAARFIYASTGSVYAPSFAPLAEGHPVKRDVWYPLTKLHAEEALALYRRDMLVTCVRPFGIYGPGQREMLIPNLIRAVCDGREITVNAPAQSPDVSTTPPRRDGLAISLCYMDDAAEALVRLLQLDAPPPVMNLAGPEAVSIRQIADSLGRLFDKEPLIRELDQPRETDLIADLQLQSRSVGRPRTGFAAGIEATAAAWKGSPLCDTSRASLPVAAAH